MEKLVYMLWKPEAVAGADFAAHMRALVADLGARGAQQITLNLVDEHVSGAMQARITRLDPPLAGTLAFWLDAVDDHASCDRLLAPLTARTAGYLVVESVPLRNATRLAALGERTPGVNMVTCIERPTRLTHDDWIAHWHGHHEQVALETQCTFLYVRNVVVRALTAAAPPWAGIVEEGFPAEAITDPRVWYCAEGSEERFRANLQRMIDSVHAFLDVDRVESHPMSQYRMTE